MRRLTLLLSLSLLAAAPALAVRPAAARARVSIVTTRSAAGRHARSIATLLQRDLGEELRRDGVDSAMEVRSTATHSDDYVVEIEVADHDELDFGGAGVNVGAVGASIDVVTARVDATFRLFSPGGEMLDEFDLASTGTSPALTGVGLGGRDGFLFVNLPFFARAPYRLAAREIARAAAARIARSTVASE